MNKAVLVLSAALAGSVAVAVLSERDLQRERARSDALAARVLALEPLERSDSSSRSDADRKLGPDAYAAGSQVGDPAVEQPTLINTPEQPTPVKTYQGTLRSRQQVERLQAALANGTPLQEYQVQALITAIDDVRGAIEQARGKRDATRSEAQNLEAQSEANERILQVAGDILFESQIEKLIELLDDDIEARKNEVGR